MQRMAPGRRLELQKINSLIHKKSDKEWYCVKCNKLSTTKGNLQRHIRLLHLKELAEHACDYCDAKFATPQQAVLHVAQCKHISVID